MMNDIVGFKEDPDHGKRPCHLTMPDHGRDEWHCSSYNRLQKQGRSLRIWASFRSHAHASWRYFLAYSIGACQLLSIAGCVIPACSRWPKPAMLLQSLETTVIVVAVLLAQCAPLLLRRSSRLPKHLILQPSGRVACFQAAIQRKQSLIMACMRPKAMSIQLHAQAD